MNCSRFSSGFFPFTICQCNAGFLLQPCWRLACTKHMCNLTAIKYPTGCWFESLYQPIVLETFIHCWILFFWYDSFFRYAPRLFSKLDFICQKFLHFVPSSCNYNFWVFNCAISFEFLEFISSVWKSIFIQRLN